VSVSIEIKTVLRQLPGNIRQRVLRALQGLRQEVRPHNSRVLDMSDSEVSLAPGMEVRRIRMANLRIIYLVEEETKLITVLAVRKRPPYQYEDLEKLLKN